MLRVSQRRISGVADNFMVVFRQIFPKNRQLSRAGGCPMALTLQIGPKLEDNALI
jgi:hypothetical protein